MQNFQGNFETPERLFITAFSICMTVLLKPSVPVSEIFLCLVILGLLGEM